MTTLRDSVKRRIQKDLQVSLGNRKYLAVIFAIGDDGKLHMIRETNAFPVSDFNTALQLLRDDFNLEVEKLNGQERQEKESG